MRILCLIAPALAACAGCSGYEPRPIVERAILRELEAVRLETLATPREDGDADSAGPLAAPAAGGVRGAVSPPRTRAASARLDASDGLSLDETVLAALLLNPDLRALRKERGVADGELIAAGLLANPELSFGWFHLDRFTNSLATSGFDIGLAWSPPRPGETGAREEKARARIDEVRAQVAGAEWRLATDVRKAYLRLVAASGRAALADAAVRLGARVRAALGQRGAVGDASRVDLMLVELEYGETLRESAGANAERDRAQLSLGRLLGLPPRAPPVRLDVRQDPLRIRPLRGATATAHLLDPAALEELMLDHRPDVAAAKHAHEQVEAELRLAYLRRIPWPRFGPTFMRDELEGKIQNRFGVSVGIELPIANQNEGEIARLEADRERARAAFTARLHAARGEVHDAARRIEAAREQVRIFDEVVSPAAAEALSLVETGLAAGAIDVVRVVAIQAQALRAREGSIEARRAFWDAVFDLEEALGADLTHGAEGDRKP